MTWSKSRGLSRTTTSLQSSPGPLYQNEVKCSAFGIEMIFHSHANKTHFHKEGCALGLILKVRVFGTWKWPIGLFFKMYSLCESGLRLK